MTCVLDVHKELSEATAAQHEAVERKPRLAALMSPDVSRSDVAEALRVFHRHYAAWDPALCQSLEGRMPDGFLSRRAGRVAAVRADLQELGVSVGPVERRKVLGFEEALGWLYVHEGASHGGLVIRKHLERRLGHDIAGLSFFAGYGRETARMWAETLGVIEGHIQSSDDMDRAIHGARTAFSELARVAELDHL